MPKPMARNIAAEMNGRPRRRDERLGRLDDVLASSMTMAGWE